MSDRIVLLVEDNSNDEALTLRALKKANISNKVVVVRDGAEAIDYLHAKGKFVGRNVADVPQVVLLDLNLPKVGGHDVLRAIRADAGTRLIPVVVLTSSKQERDLFEGYKLGANSYVVKPVDFSQFSAAVGQLGLYWLLLNERPPNHIIAKSDGQ
jgi:two-component system response regulator